MWKFKINSGGKRETNSRLLSRFELTREQTRNDFEFSFSKNARSLQYFLIFNYFFSVLRKQDWVKNRLTFNCFMKAAGQKSPYKSFWIRSLKIANYKLVWWLKNIANFSARYKKILTKKIFFLSYQKTALKIWKTKLTMMITNKRSKIKKFNGFQFDNF